MVNNDDDITFGFRALICYLSWAAHQLYEIGKDYYTYFIDEMGWGFSILDGHLVVGKKSFTEPEPESSSFPTISHIVFLPILWPDTSHLKINLMFYCKPLLWTK